MTRQSAFSTTIKKGNAACRFDLIESERPKADAPVLKLATENEFSVTDFVLTRDGVCRLSPQLARAIAGLIA